MDLSGQDLDNVTRTMLAEAKQPYTPAGMASVASVIRNRLAFGGFGNNPSEIVHAPGQLAFLANHRSKIFSRRCRINKRL
jgi:spore germination cell wall hydrolase CwlJ-like protein